MLEMLVKVAAVAGDSACSMGNDLGISPTDAKQVSSERMCKGPGIHFIVPKKTSVCSRLTLRSRGEVMCRSCSVLAEPQISLELLVRWSHISGAGVSRNGQGIHPAILNIF